MNFWNKFVKWFLEYRKIALSLFLIGFWQKIFDFQQEIFWKYFPKSSMI